MSQRDSETGSIKIRAACSLLLENAADAVMVARDGRVVYANQALCSLMVQDAADVERLPVEDVLTEMEQPKGTLEDDAPAVEALLRGQAPGDEGGRRVSVSSVHSMVEDAAVTIMTVRARRETDRSRPRFEVLDVQAARELFHLAPDYIFLHPLVTEGEPGLFIEANESACRLLGYTRVEILERSPLDLIEAPANDQIVEETEVLETEGQLLFRKDLKCKDGSRIPVEIHTRVIDIGGKPICFSVARDISRRIDALRRAEESEVVFRTVFENLPLAARITDRSTGIRVLNRIHRTAQADTTVSGLEMVADEDREWVGRRLARIESGASDNDRFTCRYNNDSGETTWGDTSVAAVRDQEGHIRQLIAVSADVTSVVQSHSRYRALFDSALDGILLADNSGSYIDANPSACAMLGYSREELVGMAPWDLTPDVNAEAGKRMWAEFLDVGEMAGEFPLLAKDGSERISDFRAVARIEPGVHLSVFRDATDQKRIEVERARYLAMHELAAEALGVGIWWRDIETERLTWNDSLLDIYGVSRGDFEADPDFWRLRLHPDDVGRAEEATRVLREEGKAYDQVSFRIIRPDGEARHLRGSARVLRDGAGEATGYLGVNVDVTEQVAHEEALREGRERFETLFMGIPLPTYTWRRFDDGFRLETFNRAAAENLGGSRAIIEGASASEMCPDAPEFVAGLERCRLTKERARVDITYTAKSSGEVRALSAHYACVGPETVMVHIEDTTERLRLQQEHVQLERFRALGELAAGVSHNLNNILTGVMGPAQLLRRLTTDDAIREEADHIIAAARRARDLVVDLHHSVRPRLDEELAVVDLWVVLRKAVQVTRPRWYDEPISRGAAIDLNVQKMASDNLHVRATAGALEDVFVNLILNAVEAMPEGGVIEIRARRDRGEVLVSVSDNGTGMDPATITRAVEPFFTTKQSVGTGLGLSTAKATVEVWGGSLEIASRAGKGTLVQIILPAADQQQTSSHPGATD